MMKKQTGENLQNQIKTYKTYRLIINVQRTIEKDMEGERKIFNRQEYNSLSSKHTILMSCF